MPRPKLNKTLDLSDAEVNRRLRTRIATLQGKYRVKLEPAAAKASWNQHKYYRGHVCQALADHLMDQTYEIVTVEQAHIEFAKKFLTKPLNDPETGEYLGVDWVRSTGDMSSEEMFDYVERCRAWLLDFFGVPTDEPDPDWRFKPARRKVGAA